MGKTTKHFRESSTGRCRWCGGAEETQAHLWWTCNAFAGIRQRHFPEFQERDVLALPALLRCTGTAPEPRIESEDACYWGAGPAGLPMTEGFARACGQGGLKQ